MSVLSLRPRGVLSRLLVLVLLLPSFVAPVAAKRGGPGSSTMRVHGPAAVPAERTFEGTVRAGRLSTATPGVMITERSEHTATLLEDGRVLLAGFLAELYDPTTRLFTRTGDPLAERREHTATRLQDGRVLVVGGKLFSTLLSSAEIYDPATGTWSATGALNRARAGHSALLLQDGRVLVVGGAPLPEIYNPATGTWTVVGTTLPGGTLEIPGGDLFERPDGDIQVANGEGVFTLDLDTGNTRDRVSFARNHQFGVVVRLQDGRVLAAGGRGVITAELYDPTTRTVTPTAPLGEDREQAATVVLPDGRVLVAGGYSPLELQDEFFPVAKLYDPTTGTWTTTGTMYGDRRGGVPTLLDDGTVLISGGHRTAGARATDTAELYDPQTGTFIRLDRLAGNVTGHATTLLQDGRVMVVGGSFGDTARIYDPTATWDSEDVTMTTARQRHAAVTLADGSVLVVGGVWQSTYLRSAELYDPTTGTFTAVGSMAEARADFTATVLPSGKVLVAGGIDADGAHATLELYDPATRTFGEFAALSMPRAGHTATLLSTGKVLLLGGIVNGVRLADAELYDPTTNAVTRTSSYPTSIGGHAATRIKGGSVLVTGGRGNINSRYAARYVTTAGVFVDAPSMNLSRTGHTMTQLVDDNVVVIGGFTPSGATVNEIEVYDPTTDGAFRIVGAMRQGRYGHTATRLADGSIFVFGGLSNSGQVTRGEIVSYVTTNTFSASLRVPDGWLSRTSTVTATGTTTDAPLAAFTFGSGGFVNATAGQPVTLPVPTDRQGLNVPIPLIMRDTDGITATVLLATVDIDVTPPRAELAALRPYSMRDVRVSWSGYDGESGIASYDVDVREEGGSGYRPLLVATTATSTTLEGTEGVNYIFRVRARDVAGNVGEWSRSVGTTVDTTPPEGTLRITAVDDTTVTVATTATDNLSGLTSMRVAVASRFDSAPFREYATSTTVPRDGVPLDQLQVYAQWTDRAGNRSKIVCARYDGAPCTDDTTPHTVFLPLVRR